MTRLIFTPMRHHGTTRVYLANNIGGFDVSGCPQPEALAQTIVRACNAHNDLVLSLGLMLSYMPAPEFDVDPARAYCVRAARAALAALAAAGPL